MGFSLSDLGFWVHSPLWKHEEHRPLPMKPGAWAGPPGTDSRDPILVPTGTCCQTEGSQFLFLPSKACPNQDPDPGPHQNDEGVLGPYPSPLNHSCQGRAQPPRDSGAAESRPGQTRGSQWSWVPESTFASLLGNDLKGT